MPELPEIHTIALDLKKNFKGFQINKVTVEHGYQAYPNNNIFAQTLEGSCIEKVGRVGKNIVVELNSGNFLTFHLAMTGRMLLKNPGSPKDPHQKVELELFKDKEKALLRFCDMRMFGKVGVRTATEMRSLKNKYGPDMMSPDTSLDMFKSKIQSKNTSIKNALLEQSLVAGVGNIYATDALWMAQIHPETKTSKLTLNQFERLFKSTKDILAEGIKHRGSTLPDEAYVDLFGKPGSHQRYFRIYGKELCPTCKSNVQYKKVNGRGTYFCPVCQK